MPNKKSGATKSKSEKERLEEIRESLIKALKNSNNETAYTVDQVDNYCFLWKIKQKLQRDINRHGIRIKTSNGNGINTEKSNESIVTKLKVDAQMLKILNDLNIKQQSPSGRASPYKK